MNLDTALALVQSACAVMPTTSWADREKLHDAMSVITSALASRPSLPSAAVPPTAPQQS